MKKAWLLTAIPPLAVWDVYKFIFARSRPPVLNALLDKKTHRPEYYVWRDERSAALESKVHLCYTLESDRGEILQGFYFPCGKNSARRSRLSCTAITPSTPKLPAFCMNIITAEALISLRRTTPLPAYPAAPGSAMMF